MYKDYVGLYENPYWLRKILQIIKSLHELGDHEFSYGDVYKYCYEADELYCIKIYFKVQKRYVKLHNSIFND